MVQNFEQDLLPLSICTTLHHKIHQKLAPKQDIGQNVHIDEQETEHREVAKKIVGMVKFQGYQTHDDLGDKANSQVNASAEKISGLRQTELALLHGDVVILVATDVSGEDAADLELARATAKKVLSKCD